MITDDGPRDMRIPVGSVGLEQIVNTVRMTISYRGFNCSFEFHESIDKAKIEELRNIIQKEEYILLKNMANSELWIGSEDFLNGIKIDKNSRIIEDQ